MAIKLKGLEKFNRELRKFAVKTVPDDALLLQKRIALDLLSRIVFRNPVDTGRSRGNWQVELGSSNDSVLDVFDRNGSATIQGGASAIAGARPFGVISIFNNVSYIQYLEKGSSQQAPTGMVDVSLVEVEAQFR